MSLRYDPDSFLSRELRPEAKLILCCARTQVEPEMVEVAKALSNLPLDWEFLCASADKHRLTQLLFRNLSTISPESMPADIKARLRHQFHSNAGSNLRLARTLIGLLQTFSAEAIPVIPFKGSILANCTYGKLALRQYYDVDLLIRSRDVSKSEQVLVREGYVCDEVFDREARYKRVDNPAEVDLHWGFTPRYFHLPVDFDELYARARRESLLGQPVITFSSEDFLEILCVQVVKDCWERQQQLEHLSKVCDIAEHVRANPQIEWPRVLERAQRKGLQRILHCALALARGLLGTELPPEVLRRVESDRHALAYARGICRSLFAEADTLSPLANPYLSIRLRFRQLRFYLGIREKYRDRIRHLVEIFKVYRVSRT
jgi:putative nucleotidyltransferase-like protein